MTSQEESPPLSDQARRPEHLDPRLRIGVIGCGYWGPHLVRNIHEIPHAELVAVSDLQQERLDSMGVRYPGIRLFRDHQDLLATDVDAVVVASPIQTHYALVREALLAGKHVLVEKPLATSAAEAADLVTLARRRRRVLMVGHTFVYNPAVQELGRLVKAGDLGRIYYGDAARLNLGQFQRHANVLWDLAPHDISILVQVLGQDPVMVSARGSACVQAGVHDVCYLEIQFSAGASAHVHVSWLDPDKVRRLTLVGDRRMAVFDDVSANTKLRIYDRGVEPAAAGGPGAAVAYRNGEIVIPYIEWREPLRLECEHFVDCARRGRRPLSDGEQGLVVVATLEAADRSLRSGGTLVAVEMPLLAATGRAAAYRNGNGAHANGNGAHANGNGAHANGNGAHANGNGAHANGNGAHANGSAAQPRGSRYSSERAQVAGGA
jgi:predicted dehydrogenase